MAGTAVVLEDELGGDEFAAEQAVKNKATIENPIQVARRRMTLRLIVVALLPSLRLDPTSSFSFRALTLDSEVPHRRARGTAHG